MPRLVDDGTTSYLHAGPGLAAETDNATGDTRFPLQDGLGSERLRTDGSGAIDATADWDAWGTLRSSSGTQGRFGWTGEPRDATTGYTHLRARDYSPGTGRFLTRDALETSGPGTQGYNRYAYALNNPVSRVDPSGHASILATAFAGIGTLSFSAVASGAVPLLGGVAVGPVMGFILLAIIFIALVIMFDFLIPCIEAARHVTCTGDVEAQPLGPSSAGFGVRHRRANSSTRTVMRSGKAQRQQKNPAPKGPHPGSRIPSQ